MPRVRKYQDELDVKDLLSNLDRFGEEGGPESEKQMLYALNQLAQKRAKYESGLEGTIVSSLLKSDPSRLQTFYDDNFEEKYLDPFPTLGYGKAGAGVAYPEQIFKGEKPKYIKDSRYKTGQRLVGKYVRDDKGNWKVKDFDEDVIEVLNKPNLIDSFKAGFAKPNIGSASVYVSLPNDTTKAPGHPHPKAQEALGSKEFIEEYFKALEIDQDSGLGSYSDLQQEYLTGYKDSDSFMSGVKNLSAQDARKMIESLVEYVKNRSSKGRERSDKVALDHYNYLASLSDEDLPKSYRSSAELLPAFFYTSMMDKAPLLGVTKNNQPLKQLMKSNASIPTSRRNTELMYKLNANMRTGQEPYKYKVWDEKGKKWSMRDVEPEELEYYRNKNKIQEKQIIKASFNAGGRVRRYQDGGDVNDLLKMLSDRHSVSRSPKKVKQRKGVRSNEDGTESTHLMRTETLDGENWFSFPSLFQNEDGSWVDMSKDEDWMGAYKEAQKRGEVYDFGKDKETALAFGEGSWKNQLKPNYTNILSSLVSESTQPSGYTQPVLPLEIKTYKQGGALKGLIKKYGAGGSVGGWGAQGNFTTEYTSKQPDVEELEDPNLIPELNALAAQQESSGEPLTPEEERKLKGKKALQGAGKGAMAGASFGPWGAVIGGVVGGALGYFAKKGTKIKKSLYDNGGLFDALRKRRADRRISRTPIKTESSSNVLQSLAEIDKKGGFSEGYYKPYDKEITMRSSPGSPSYDEIVRHEETHATQNSPLLSLLYGEPTLRVQNPDVRKGTRRLLRSVKKWERNNPDKSFFGDIPTKPMDNPKSFAAAYMLGLTPKDSAFQGGVHEYEAIVNASKGTANKLGIDLNKSFDEVLSDLRTLGSDAELKGQGIVNLRHLRNFMQSANFSDKQKKIIMKSFQ